MNIGTDTVKTIITSTTNATIELVWTYVCLEIHSSDTQSSKPCVLSTWAQRKVSWNYYVMMSWWLPSQCCVYFVVYMMMTGGHWFCPWRARAVPSIRSNDMNLFRDALKIFHFPHSITQSKVIGLNFTTGNNHCFVCFLISQRWLI